MVLSIACADALTRIFLISMRYPTAVDRQWDT